MQTNHFPIFLYWFLTVLWGAIAAVFTVKQRYYWKADRNLYAIMRVILIIVFFIFFDSLYFSLLHSARLGLLPSFLYEQLYYSHLILIPKLGLVLAGIVVMIMLARHQWEKIIQERRETIAKEEKLRDWSQLLEERVQEKTEALIRMERQIWDLDKLATIGMMASGIIHEINNPLYGISNYVQLLLSKEEVNEKKDYLELINKGVGMIRETTQALLDLSRLTDLEFSQVDIKEIINGVLGLTGTRLPDARVRIKKNYHKGLPLIHADANKLEQVFLNIIINALEAMPEGGTLTISIVQAENEIELNFKDTGGGIAPDDIPKIFEPFFSRKEKGKGTGLGLFVTASIIRAHRGNINIISELGKGTLVKVKLPLRLEETKNERTNTNYRR